MKSMPDVSIIIPIYNAEKYLMRCLDSIIFQMEENDELILIDDASSDKSGEICDTYSANHENIVVVHQSNKGVGGARNSGLKIAKGSYIMFVDADDFADVQMISCVKQQIGGNYDVILFEHVVEDAQGAIKHCVKKNAKVHTYSKEDSDLFIKCNFGALSPIQNSNFNMRSVWAKAYRREFLLDKQLLFDETLKIGEDMIFCLKVYGLFESAVCVEYPIYHYFFENPCSITNSYKPDLEQNISLYDQAIKPWIEENSQYVAYYANYRLNDIILYMKYDFFHSQNRESEKSLKERMYRILIDGSYPEYYGIARKSCLLNNNKLSKRITFFFAIHGMFDELRILAYLKYRFVKK